MNFHLSLKLQGNYVVSVREESSLKYRLQKKSLASPVNAAGIIPLRQLYAGIGLKAAGIT